MFKLKKIIVNGFKNDKRRIEYEFSDTNTTIMYGDNGCGKTTLLQILHAIFAHDEAILLNNKVKSIEITFENKKETHCVVIDELKDVSELLEKKVQYNWGEFENYNLSNISTLLVGVERGANLPASGVQASMVNEFFRMNSLGSRAYTELGPTLSRRFSEQLAEYLTYYRNRRVRYNSKSIFDSEHLYLKGNNVDISIIEETILQRYNKVRIDASNKIQSALFQTFSQVINGKYNNCNYEENLSYVKNELEPNFLLISKSLDSIPNSENNDVLMSIKDKSLQELIHKCENSEHICLLMKNIIQSIMPEREMLNSVLLLQSKFNAHLINGKEMNINADGISITLNENGKHRLNELSSGECQFLTLLTCFIVDSSKRNIILIDEPELSLNINWQDELIDLISECAPETQIIIATHSPAVVGEHIDCIKELG